MALPMLVKAAPSPSYQSVEIEAEPSATDGPGIAAPGRCFLNTVKSFGCQLPTVSPDFLFATTTNHQKPQGKSLFVSPPKPPGEHEGHLFPTQNKPQPVVEIMVCRSQGDLSQFLKTCHRGLEETLFWLSFLGMGMGRIFCLANGFRVGAPGKNCTFVKKTLPFQHIFLHG